MMDGSEVHDGFTGLDELFVILTQAPSSPEPAKRALNNPALRLHDKAALGWVWADDLQVKVVPLAHRLFQVAALGLVGPDLP